MLSFILFSTRLSTLTHLSAFSNRSCAAMSSTQLSLRSIKAAFLTKLVFAFISISKLHFLLARMVSK
ncbi:hypothetical protein HanPI659440_Chr04g0144871 [Helianthus annuus]|nr:hypothetical protein HanPI659440_Chr04g0144871 [Helianthus annuus]